jgi:polyhydroxybutyrate depolymerase
MGAVVGPAEPPGPPRAGRPASLAACLLVLLVSVTGCSATSAPAGPRAATRASGSAGQPAPGLSSYTVTSGGRNRSYLLYRPASLPSGRVPLVVMLHGGGGSAARAASSYGWNAEARRGHFAVAYPQGSHRGWSVGGGCCGRPARAHVDDVAFVTKMVRAVSRRLPIDPRRIYATGTSEGGMLAERLACDSTLFAAIGPASATRLGRCPSPEPISVIHIHGTADRRIPYDGSRGAGVYHIDGPPLPALVARWRSVDRCKPPSSTRTGSVTRSRASCPNGRAVELVTIAGAGHGWPGRSCRARCARGRANRPSTALDATSTVWRFFAAHPKPAS